MSCIKNPKKWLWFHYNNEHHERPTYLRKFMSANTTFMVDWKCELCGCQRTDHFITWDELLEMGFDNNDILKANNDEGVFNPIFNHPYPSGS